MKAYRRNAREREIQREIIGNPTVEAAVTLTSVSSLLWQCHALCHKGNGVCACNSDHVCMCPNMCVCFHEAAHSVCRKKETKERSGRRHLYERRKKKRQAFSEKNGSSSMFRGKVFLWFDVSSVTITWLGQTWSKSAHCLKNLCTQNTHILCNVQKSATQ